MRNLLNLRTIRNKNEDIEAIIINEIPQIGESNYILDDTDEMIYKRMKDNGRLVTVAQSYDQYFDIF